MNRQIYLVLLLPLLAWATVAPAFSRELSSDDFNGYEGVEKYTRGSLAIARALSADVDTRQFYLEDALDYLKPQTNDNGESVSFSKTLDAEIDSGRDLEKSANGVTFDYNYARGEFNLQPWRENNTVRDPFGRKAHCRVRNFTLKPEGKLLLHDIQTGDSYVIIVTERPDAASLSVAGSEVFNAESAEDGYVQFAHWNEPTENDVDYSITNLSSQPLSFVVICN